MSLKALSDYTLYAKYSHYLPEKKRRETWPEIVDRVFGMHERKFAKQLAESEEFRSDFEFAKRMVRKKRVLGSQRALQFAGPWIERENFKLFNCSAQYIDRPRAFSEGMYVLLCGVGLGFSVQKEHVNKLPNLHPIGDSWRKFKIEDSIEGWSDAVGAIVSSYFPEEASQFPHLSGHKVIFDYSQIRPEGALIANQFKAPGHKGLEKAIEHIRNLIEKRINSNEFKTDEFAGKLRPIDCYDIIMHASDAILSGGVRRCLAGDSEVFTDKGLVCIKDLEPGDRVLTHKGQYKRVRSKICNGIRETVVIKTNCGDYVSTPNHRWMIAKNLSGEPEEKLAEDLQSGDSFIFCGTPLLGFSESTIPSTEQYGAPELNTETAWFLGYFLGNGSCSVVKRANGVNDDSKFRVSAPRGSEVNNKISEKLKREFSVFVGENFGTHDRGTSIEFSCSKKSISAWAMQHLKQTNTEIRIPDFIKKSNLEVRKAFLAGVLDSDGSVRNETFQGKGVGQICLVSTKYKRFANDVRILTATLGIPSSITLKKREGKSDEFIVKSISSSLRARLVDYLEPYSVKLQEDYCKKQPSKEKNGLCFNKKLAEKRGDVRNIWNSNENISYENGLEAGAKFVPVSVISVEKTEREEVVYDIEVEEDHTFFVDGVLSHNSATICMFDLSDGEMINAKTGNWFLENPQRARSNNSAVLIKGKTPKEEFSKLMKSTKEFGEPGFIWVEEGERMGTEIVFNPCCLPKWLTVSHLQKGTIPLSSLRVGDKIFTTEGFSEVTAILDSGVKDIFHYRTSGGKSFFSTEDHRVVSKGEIMEIKDAEYIDVYNEFYDRTDSEKIIFKSFYSKEEALDIEVNNNSHTFICDGFNIHNCEIGLYPKTEDDSESGIALCNLTEINGKFCTTEEEFLECCRASAIIGTMQAAYTKFNYVTDATKKIVEREALLGCSITGFMDNPDILLNEEIQRKGAEEIKKVNEKISKIIGINPSARLTCAKPSGSTSCILGTASGIHPHHAKRYIRRVQANRNEFPAQLYKEKNPLAVETSVWSANGTDEVVSFLCEVPRGAILKNSISAVEFLEAVRKSQENWVESGTAVENCVKPYIRHNISVTAIVKSDEWQAVEDYIFNHQKTFAGISLLPSSGDLDYQQAPFSTVLTPEEIVEEYGDASVFASGLIVDGLSAFDGNLWKGCDTVLGIGESLPDEVAAPEMPAKNGYTFKEFNKKLIEFYQHKEVYENWFAKKDWIRRVNQFAERYFNGDVRRATYCLKHVSLWKTWVDIQREHQEVDWSTVVEEDQSFIDANTLGAQACSGGACSLV
jgi:hypothetical protein